MKKIDLLPLSDATQVETGASLLTGLLRKDLKVLMSCGGKGLCSTCHVWVKRGAENLSPIGPREKRTLALVADARPESRLACQCKVFGDGVEVEVPEGMYIESADDLIALIGTRAEQNILHPVTGGVLIAKGKLITRTLFEQSRGVAADLNRAKAGDAASDSASHRSFVASGSGHRPPNTATTHHLSTRTVFAPRPPGAPTPPVAPAPAVNPPGVAAGTGAAKPKPPFPAAPHSTQTPLLGSPPSSAGAGGPGSRATEPYLNLSTQGPNGSSLERFQGSSRRGPGSPSDGGARSLPQPQPGSQIGKYLLIECIGRGGAGMVYRALHTKLKTPVAIKFLRPDVLAGDAEALPRLTREAQLLAQLIHPNVVRVLDYEDDPARPFVVMEFVDGLSAADLIKQSGQVAPSRVAEIGLHVSEGLDAARRIGVVHRDVKPGNILLTRDGASKLVDLGLAVVSRADGGADGATTAIEGTVGYMAPEQALGAAVDHRSDQYSLGCTMYHLLTGRLPFTGHSAHEILLQHLRCPAPSAHETSPGVPVALSRVVQTMMEKSAEDRYPSYAALRTDLQAFV